MINQCKAPTHAPDVNEGVVEAVDVLVDVQQIHAQLVDVGLLLLPHSGHMFLRAETGTQTGPRQEAQFSVSGSDVLR